MTRSKTILKITFIFVALFAIGCVTTDLGDNAGTATAGDDSLKIAYLKTNIHAQDYPDKGGKTSCRASYANWTNPGDGHVVIPVNTQVDIGVRRGWKGREILITRTEDEKQIHMEYDIGRMGMGLEEYIDLITSPTANPVDLAGFSETDQKGIREGKPYKGMTKEGIRIALGYPAAHKTPSLEENTWIYWQTRYTTLEVVFDETGKVARIRR